MSLNDRMIYEWDKRRPRERDGDNWATGIRRFWKNTVEQYRVIEKETIGEDRYILIVQL